MNTPLTCIIVDDEPLAVRLLESYAEKTPGLKLLATFTDSILPSKSMPSRVMR